MRREADILLDFDGTCVAWQYPGVGPEIGAVPTLKELIKNGHRLILFTVRSNHDGGVIEALEWFKKNDIELYGIQRRPEQHRWGSSPKPFADLIIDDTALGIPLKFDESLSERPFVDWDMVRLLLREKGYFNKTLTTKDL